MSDPIRCGVVLHAADAIGLSATPTPRDLVHEHCRCLEAAALQCRLIGRVAAALMKLLHQVLKESPLSLAAFQQWETESLRSVVLCRLCSAIDRCRFNSSSRARCYRGDGIVVVFFLQRKLGHHARDLLEAAQRNCGTLLTSQFEVLTKALTATDAVTAGPFDPGALGALGSDKTVDTQ